MPFNCMPANCVATTHQSRSGQHLVDECKVLKLSFISDLNVKTLIQKSTMNGISETTHDSSMRETKLPDALFSAVIGIICFAIMIIMK